MRQTAKQPKFAATQLTLEHERTELRERPSSALADAPSVTAWPLNVRDERRQGVFDLLLARMAEILNVGFDSALLTSRRVSLERAGHHVAQAHDLPQVLSACKRKSLQLVILCNTLNESEKMRVADVVRRFCGDAMLLDLHNGSRPDLPYADAHLQAPTSRPQELLQAVHALSRRYRPRRPAS